MHREGVPGTFTGRYAIHRLVYHEFFQYVSNAIQREKELKHWTRAQKVELIERGNPTWEDLYPKLVEVEVGPTATTAKADSLRE